MVAKILKSILFAVIIIFSITIFSTTANSQIGFPADIISSLGSAYLSSSMSIKTYPANPGPNELVTATLQLYSIDLDKAEISWYLNGILQNKGSSDKSFQFQTGPVGSATKISVSVNAFDGSSGHKEVIMRPAEVDILYNSNTYSPPFYRGKSLFTDKSQISLVALPNMVNAAGNQINPKNLVYRWYRGNTILGTNSGLGKNTLTLKGNFLFQPLNMKVEVKALDDSISAEGSLIIYLNNPEVLIYENHPLQGIKFNKALSDFILEEKEIKISAIPFFFEVPTRNSSDLEYKWSQNRKPIKSPEQPSEIVLRQVGEALPGKANIGIEVANKENIFSRGSRNITITTEN